MKVHLLALSLAVAVASAMAKPSADPHRWHPAPADALANSMRSPNLPAMRARNLLFRTQPRPAPQTPAAAFRPSGTAAQQDCGIENTDSSARVVNGQEARPNQFPWVAAVGCYQEGWYCTGSFISEDWVMTAAHCIDGCGSNQFDVLAGAHSLTEAEPNKVQIIADLAVPHEGYNSITLANDIAVVHLPEPAPLSENVRLACLPPKGSSDTYEGELTTVTGWGKLSDDTPLVSDRLNYATDRPVISNDECALTYGSIITPGHICIDTETGSGTGGGIGVCNGDSGGPLNWKSGDRYVQIGVADFVSSGGCENKTPHGFTRVSYFLDWIEENTGISIP